MNGSAHGLGHFGGERDGDALDGTHKYENIMLPLEPKRAVHGRR